tara:strand:- start:313 stop:528 length:216 start_codon:yes stop_codon:yes gene_type:complete
MVNVGDIVISREESVFSNTEEGYYMSGYLIVTNIIHDSIINKTACCVLNQKGISSWVSRDDLIVVERKYVN